MLMIHEQSSDRQAPQKGSLHLDAFSGLGFSNHAITASLTIPSSLEHCHHCFAVIIISIDDEHMLLPGDQYTGDKGR